MWSLAIAWNLNLSAEVAAVAEVRDSLARDVNESFALPNGTRVFRKEVVGDVGRGSFSTVAAVTLVGGTLLITQVLAVIYAVAPWSFSGTAPFVGPVAITVQLACTVFAAIAIGCAVAELYQYRSRARRYLRWRVGESPYGDDLRAKHRFIRNDEAPTW